MTKKKVKLNSDEVAIRGLIRKDFYKKAVRNTERAYTLTSSSLKVPYRQSFGLLIFDFLSGGGIIPGTMVQISGKEGSGKSTLSGHAFGEALKVKLPIIEYRDPENALTESMLQHIVRAKDLNTLFGGDDPQAYYYTDQGLEVFYNSVKHTLKQLPDKLWHNEERKWYYVFDQDKVGRQMFSDAGFTSYDKKKFQETKRLWVETNNSYPQGIIFLDSYPALLAEKDDEDDDTSAAMALDARAFSKNIKRIVGRLKRKGFIVLGVNQIRDRPGQMHGCLHSDTSIPFVNGNTYTISEIVENKIKGEVWAWDENKEEFVAATIVNWFNNGNVRKESDWITISSNEAVFSKNGVVSVTVTPDHKILTHAGWKKAKNITTNDMILTKETTIEKWVAVTSITRGSGRKFRKKEKFDIEVKGFHNYLAGNKNNGFVVHNSPEYEPGGNALAFYSGLRFQVRKVSVPQGMPRGKTEDGTDSGEFSTESSIYGKNRTDNYIYINVRNTKNKGGTPYGRAKMRILYSDGKRRMLGYDPVWDTMEYLKLTGRINGTFKKGFTINVPEMDKFLKGFTKKKFEYLDFKLLIMAEVLKESKLLERVRKELKIKKPCLRSILFKEIRNKNKMMDLLDKHQDNKAIKTDDEEDLEA